MFKEINTLISNDLKNYDKRPLTKSIIDREGLYTIQCYTAMYAEDEKNRDAALSITYNLDKRLHYRIEHISGYGIYIGITDDFLASLEELQSIDEALRREECDNLGFGNDAKLLRRKWRRKLRELNKTLNKQLRERVRYIKEWDRRRTTYISNLTGECHNGLWWTIRACINCPQLIKYGFIKESK